MIGQIYASKIFGDNDDDFHMPHAPRQTLEQFTYEFFHFKFGLRTYAEAHLRALVETVIEEAATGKYRTWVTG